ncbi:MAG: imidazolonepropionase [Bacteroidota bacterium]|nr:imidazolonepropionase [Bacteroidota bacterium]
MRKIFINVKEILKAEKNPQERVCGKDMSEISRIEKAFLIIEDEKIVDFGEMNNFDSSAYNSKEIELIDLKNEQYIFPAFVDSHTHIVYADNREKEFVDKIKGLSYEEIAKRGGGILNSAQKLHEATEDELFTQAKKRLEEMMQLGTCAVEIKSGYGLNTHDELKMLRVIKKLQEKMPLTIVPTFLGAHAVPNDYKGRQTEYVDMVINEMIPIVASENLADFIDVFCDRGFFTVEETDRILNAGMKYGLRAKIHANELDYSGGVQVGVKYNALSVDHLEFMGDKEINSLKNSETMPTILPGTAFFLGLPYSPARKMIEAGLPIAMASDYNPGSSPSGNMKFIMSMACAKYKLLPEEALNAITQNTAYAMNIADSHGSISPGKYANLIVTKPIPSFEFFPYAFGDNLIDSVYIKGKLISN